MNMKLIKGYTLTVVSALVVLAVGVLVSLQWGNSANFSFYGKNFSVDDDGGVNTAILMLCSAGGGVVIIVVLWTLLKGIGAIRKGHRLARQTRVIKTVEAQQARNG